jgi:hypothetical protein
VEELREEIYMSQAQTPLGTSQPDVFCVMQLLTVIELELCSE